MSAMSTPEERRKTRDRLFQSLFAALPEDQKRIVKDYARRTLTENPPTMQKSEVCCRFPARAARARN
eukprot:3449771-Rhodomonas_salina.1